MSAQNNTEMGGDVKNKCIYIYFCSMYGLISTEKCGSN